MTTDPTAGATRNPGGCLQPVLLRGRIDHLDGATGELLHRYTTVHEPGGVLPIACKTRRASQCPPCADVYRADTYQVIRTGLSAGKDIPETVASHPSVFTTLTAPSFARSMCAARKTARSCVADRVGGANSVPTASGSLAPTYTRDDPLLGEPLCPDCYDYTGAVLFNACAPELWRRFTIALRRTLARQAGLTNKALAAQVRVSFAKVAEYQRRGVVHFHAIIRLGGPTGPDTPPPAWANMALLTAAIDQASRAVHLQTPAAPGVPARTVAWGRQADIRPITTTGTLTDARVAAYVAKYATKAAECTGTLDRRLASADQLDALPLRHHVRRLIATCLRLGSLPGLEDLRLAAWAHMLGFRGHFSTKSRRYSTTFSALRAERAQHQREHATTDTLWATYDDNTLVLAKW